LQLERIAYDDGPSASPESSGRRLRSGLARFVHKKPSNGLLIVKGKQSVDRGECGRNYRSKKKLGIPCPLDGSRRSFSRKTAGQDIRKRGEILPEFRDVGVDEVPV